MVVFSSVNEAISNHQKVNTKIWHRMFGLSCFSSYENALGNQDLCKSFIYHFNSTITYSPSPHPSKLTAFLSSERVKQTSQAPFLNNKLQAAKRVHLFPSLHSFLGLQPFCTQWPGGPLRLSSAHRGTGLLDSVVSL